MALLKNDEYFTDAEIDMINSCSKYRYPSKNILSLKSSHIQILGRDEIIFSVHRGKETSIDIKPKIMNLFEDLPTIENTKESFTGGRSKQMEQEYAC